MNGGDLNTPLCDSMPNEGDRRIGGALQQQDSGRHRRPTDFYDMLLHTIRGMRTRPHSTYTRWWWKDAVSDDYEGMTTSMIPAEEDSDAREQPAQPRQQQQPSASQSSHGDEHRAHDDGPDTSHRRRHHVRCVRACGHSGDGGHGACRNDTMPMQQHEGTRQPSGRSLGAGYVDTVRRGI